SRLSLSARTGHHVRDRLCALLAWRLSFESREKGGAMRSRLLRKPVGIAMALLFSLPAVALRSVVDAPTDCSAGKPYCYETPVHLDSLINTPGFEGKPSLSADGLELYFVSDRPGALGV